MKNIERKKIKNSKNGEKSAKNVKNLKNQNKNIVANFDVKQNGLSKKDKSCES